MMIFLVLMASVSAMYLPGVAHMEYMKGSPVDLKVIKLDSTQTLLPYAYYALPFCQPEGGIRDMIDNLGEILQGDRIENSPFRLSALNDVKCQKLCQKKYTKKEMQKFHSFIADDYRAHWMVDGLPAAFNKGMMLVDKQGKGTTIYSEGFPVGSVEYPDNKVPKDGLTLKQKKNVNVRLNNHVLLRLLYNPGSNNPREGPVSIVQFEVIPSSVAYDTTKGDSVPSSCPPSGSEPPLTIRGGGSAAEQTVVWTYSVEWVASEVKWSTRWDIFLHEEGDDQIHWFSIINSLMIVLFLTGIVAVIMLKTVSADFRKYRELETQEEAQEETGWKLVHGDVFRPPAHEMLLSVFVGNGVQVLTMTGLTLLVALLGFLSPANRGALLTSILVLYALMGIQAGYVSARLYKLMKGTQWKRNTVQTALLVPGIALSIFFILNLVLASEKSSASVGFFRLFTIAFLWIGVSVPLVFVGA